MWNKVLRLYNFRSEVLKVVKQKIIWLLLHYEKKNGILITPIIQIIIFDGEEQWLYFKLHPND